MYVYSYTESILFGSEGGKMEEPKHWQLLTNHKPGHKMCDVYLAKKMNAKWVWGLYENP